MTFEFTVILLLFIGIVSYALGFTAASMAERHAKREAEEQVRILKAQKGSLTDWVRANWPNEYMAYLRGHAIGYQQGVLQGPALEEDET